MAFPHILVLSSFSCSTFPLLPFPSSASYSPIPLLLCPIPFLARYIAVLSSWPRNTMALRHLCVLDVLVPLRICRDLIRLWLILMRATLNMSELLLFPLGLYLFRLQFFVSLLSVLLNQEVCLFQAVNTWTLIAFTLNSQSRFFNWRVRITSIASYCWKLDADSC